MQLPPTYADQLRAARWRAGLTQKELAKRLGVTQSKVSQWERAHWSTPPDDMGALIRDELGVPWPPRYLSYDEQVWLMEDVQHFFRQVHRDGVQHLQRHFERFVTGVAMSLRAYAEPSDVQE